MLPVHYRRLPKKEVNEMTFFEQKGVELQLDCETIEQAVRTFEYSCRVCCSKGCRISCDRCAISATHEQVCSLITDRLEDDRKRRIEQMKARKAVAACK